MTKKISIALVAITALNVNVYAKDWFIGTDVGNSKMNYVVKGISSVKDNSDGNHIGITVGKYINDNVRIGASIYTYKEDKGVDVSNQEIGLDYLFGTSAFKPLIGIGIANFSFKESGFVAEGFNKDTIKLSGIGYGLKAGALYEINKNFDFEFGYKYMKHSKKDKITYVPTSTEVSIESKNLSAWYVGLTYNF